VVALATLTDLHLSGDLSAATQRLANALNLGLGWRDAIDGLRNLALFAGLGSVWVATSVSGKVRAEVRKAVLVGCALSAIIEGMQAFSPTRTASVVDVATNTFGAFSGALGTAHLIADVGRTRGARSYLGIPAFLLAAAYALATLCEALTPLFRNDQLPYVAGGPTAWLRFALHSSLPLSPAQIPVIDFLLFAPAGFLLVMMLSEREAGAAWRRVAAVGTGIVIIAELAHGAIRLPIRWEAAAVHAVAWGVGAWAAQRWLAPLSRALRGPARARAALGAYAAVLVLWGWRPFLPETSGAAIAAQFTTRHLVPLQSLAGRVDVFSAMHVAQQFFLYFPLGCLLAVWPLRLTGRWLHLWPGLWLALVLEAGHALIADRYLDVTNALIACAGLGMGWLVVRRVGFRPYGAALWAARTSRTSAPAVSAPTPDSFRR
jgi:glycopeptide antibiotics resistance protein